MHLTTSGQPLLEMRFVVPVNQSVFLSIGLATVNLSRQQGQGFVLHVGHVSPQFDAVCYKIVSSFRSRSKKII